MQVIHVQTGEPEVSQAGLHLVTKIGGCHAVAVPHHILVTDDAGGHEGLENISVAVARRSTIVRDVPAFRGDQDFVTPTDPVADHLRKGLSDHPLAALATVTNGTVEDVT